MAKSSQNRGSASKKDKNAFLSIDGLDLKDLIQSSPYLVEKPSSS